MELSNEALYEDYLTSDDISVATAILESWSYQSWLYAEDLEGPDDDRDDPGMDDEYHSNYEDICDDDLPF